MYANGTTHYNLPQTVGTDKRDWTDTNQAFADIDAALYTASETASSAASDIVTLGETVGTHGFKLQDHFRIKGSCPRAEAVGGHRCHRPGGGPSGLEGCETDSRKVQAQLHS